MAQIKLQQFEGPLGLLLKLIEDQKLDITQIALAQVTEQFLGYVKRLEEIDPTALADFLNIAAKLLVIKSKAILPSLKIDDEIADDDIDEEDLATKLQAYKEFKEVAKYLKELDAKKQQSFTRLKVFVERVYFWPDPAVNPELLLSKVKGVVSSLKELDNLPKAKVREAVSIQERITHLQGRLAQKVETKLSELLSTAKNKGEVIITFLALLELIKQRLFTVDQDSLFTDITIKQYTPTEVIETEIMIDESGSIDEDGNDASQRSESNGSGVSSSQPQIETITRVSVWSDDADDEDENDDDDNDDEDSDDGNDDEDTDEDDDDDELND